MKAVIKQQSEQEQQESKRPYAPPTIIYSGQISTRAGSGLPGGSGEEHQVDPANLFSD